MLSKIQNADVTFKSKVMLIETPLSNGFEKTLKLGRQKTSLIMGLKSLENNGENNEVQIFTMQGHNLVDDIYLKIIEKDKEGGFWVRLLDGWNKLKKEDIIEAYQQAKHNLKPVEKSILDQYK